MAFALDVNYCKNPKHCKDSTHYYINFGVIITNQNLLNYETAYFSHPIIANSYYGIPIQFIG